MIEFQLDTDQAAAGGDFTVSVIGIGGAGANVLDRIALEGMPGAELICMNSDVRALTTSMASRKVQLGRALTQGLGAGGDPELGLEAAVSSSQEIREMLAGRSTSLSVKVRTRALGFAFEAASRTRRARSRHTRRFRCCSPKARPSSTPPSSPPSSR